MDKSWKGFVVVIGLMLLCMLVLERKQSSDIAELAGMIEQNATKQEVGMGDAALRQELLIKLQNSELERDRVDRLISDQIATMLQSLDNLATGVRELNQGLAEHRTGHEDLAKSHEALAEAEAKVAEVESAVRALIVSLEESRRAAVGVSTGTVTVLSPEDQVLSAIEVANLVDRLDREIQALRDQLAEARLLEKEIRERQSADEAKEEGD